MAKAKVAYRKLADMPDGCSLFARCLECPLPVCRYDVPTPLWQEVLRRLRVEEGAAGSTSPEPVAARGERR